ncbi:192_t:CDS:1 [Funneliformis mosseae]|uniref:192_t:CDS:1 n=1 Tax=Funneliformis mosseae TaxID=27381 RepID=A0A9N9I075_FUNMO|nr:192_t:CDS:1 [Funneliformis mosseae]
MVIIHCPSLESYFGVNNVVQKEAHFIMEILINIDEPLSPMASSKLFRGNSPELLRHIIQYLRKDFETLHSCVLVNRYFCRITIPILWEDPFSVKCRRGNSYNFLDVYFSYFNDDDRTSLKKNGFINNPSPFLKPLFDYPNFIKTLNISRVTLHVDNYLNYPNKSTSLNNAIKFAFGSMLEEDYRIYPNIPRMSRHTGHWNYSKKDLIYKICIILFDLFINRDASLNNFVISIDKSRENFLMNRIYKKMLNDAKFISKVEDINLSLSTIPTIYPDPIPIFTSLPSLIPSIKHLRVCNYTNQLFAKNFLQSQTQLLSLSLNNACGIDIDSFKYCFNTLTIIKFEYCPFINFLSLDGLRNLTQLKSLHIDRCTGITSRFLQPLLDIPTPLKIKSLKVIGLFPKLALLLQKIGSYLEHLELYLFDDDERDASFESIMRFCDKIKFLYLSNFDQQNVTQLYELITHVNKHLRYLSIRNERLFLNDNYFLPKSCKIINSMIFKGLGQILPDSLEYLCLDFEIKPKDLKVFLDHCQHVGLKKILVRNDDRNFIDETFRILKEFVEGKRVKYFAYELSRPIKPKHSKYRNLKMLASEVQPFVKMRKYSDLIITISDF